MFRSVVTESRPVIRSLQESGSCNIIWGDWGCEDRYLSSQKLVLQPVQSERSGFRNCPPVIAKIARMVDGRKQHFRKPPKNPCSTYTSTERLSKILCSWGQKSVLTGKMLGLWLASKNMGHVQKSVVGRGYFVVFLINLNVRIFSQICASLFLQMNFVWF